MSTNYLSATLESVDKLTTYENQAVSFESSSEVKEGVTCDVYSFTDDKTKDLGVIFVKKGFKTPLQQVLSGKKTLEIFKSGAGILKITNKGGLVTEYVFPEHKEAVEVQIGETMQWEAIEDLEFYEVCYPPYKEGRFENITE